MTERYDILQYGFIAKASQPPSRAEMSRMITDFEALEELYDVTGVIVYDAAGFLIVLEGDGKSVSKVADRLKADSCLTDVETVLLEASNKRLYSGWGSARCNAKFRPPLQAELTALRAKIEAGITVSLINTKILDYLAAFQKGRHMMQSNPSGNDLSDSDS